MISGSLPYVPTPCKMFASPPEYKALGPQSPLQTTLDHLQKIDVTPLCPIWTLSTVSILLPPLLFEPSGSAVLNTTQKDTTTADRPPDPLVGLIMLVNSSFQSSCNDFYG